MQIYIGPDDRDPRWLYWSTVLVLLFDLVISIEALVTATHSNDDSILQSRQIKVIIVNGFITVIVLPNIICGNPKVLTIWILSQIFSFIRAVGYAYGLTIAGEQLDGVRLAYMLVWYAGSITIAVAYVVVRSREKNDENLLREIDPRYSDDGKP